MQIIHNLSDLIIVLLYILIESGNMRFMYSLNIFKGLNRNGDPYFVKYIFIHRNYYRIQVLIVSRSNIACLCSHFMSLKEEFGYSNSKITENRNNMMSIRNKSHQIYRKPHKKSMLDYIFIFWREHEPLR